MNNIKVFGIVILFFLFVLQSKAQKSSSRFEGMVLVPGNDEIENFYIDKFEVTHEEFMRFVQESGYVTVAEEEGGHRQYSPDGSSYKIERKDNWRCEHYQEQLNITEDSIFKLIKNYPVTRMAPRDAEAYAKWAGKRLPTLSEWKHAAKAGQNNYRYKYPGSNNLRKVGWFETNARDQLQIGGMLEPNELGIYDLAGNVGEIVKYDDQDNKYIQKGGFFIGTKDYCEIEEDYIYHNLSPKDSWIAFGFRCVKDIEK